MAVTVSERAYTEAVAPVRTMSVEGEKVRRTASVRLLAATLAFVAATGVTTARVIHNLSTSPPPAKALADFRDNSYYPGVAFFEGINPYDAQTYAGRYPVTRSANPYPPLSILIHLPFAYFPLPVAETLHYLLNIALSLVLAFLTLRIAGLKPSPEWVLGIAALLQLSRPGHTTMFIGQSAFYLSVATYLALLYADQRPWLSALGLALTLAKPSVGGPLLVLLLCRREIGTVVRGVTLAALVSIPITVALVERAGGIGSLLVSMRSSFRHFSEDPGFWDVMSVIRIDLAATAGRLLGHSLARIPETLIMLGALGVGGLAVARLLRVESARSHAVSTATACLTVLVCTYHQAYDALLLAAPMCVLAAADGRLEQSALRKWRWILIFLLTVPAVNYLVSDTVKSALHLPGPLWQAILLANGLAVAATFLIWITVALTDPAPPAFKSVGASA